MARRSSRSWKVLESRSLGALVEQAGDHVADAGLAGRVLRRAAAEGIFHRDQRHGGVLHEPGFDAARRNQVLDFGRGVRRHRRQREAGGRQRKARRRAEIRNEVLKMVHERFSSRFGVASLIR